MATNAMALRRMVSATRLTAELGHADILDALKHAEEMRSALRVIHTWAGVHGALDARHVLDLTAKALHIGSNAEVQGQDEAQLRTVPLERPVGRKEE